MKTELRKEQLTRAVLAVIAEHGVRNLSMARVARQIGLVPSAIYRHFRNKDEMLQAMLEFIRTNLLQNVADVRAGTRDPLKRLKLLMSRHMKLIQENAGLPRIVYSEEVFSGSRDRKAKLREIIESYLEQVAAIVGEGQQAGVIRRDVEPGAASLWFLGMIQPAVLLWHLSEADFDVDRHAARSWKIFAESIAPPGKRRKGR